MNSWTKKISSLLIAATMVCPLTFSGCDQVSDFVSDLMDKYQSKIDDSMFLKAEGELVKTASGETVYLRGVNAGGLFVVEQWMNGFVKESWSENSDIVARDHKTTTQVFVERFGEEDTQELWRTYRENWWSEADFENCVNMGINVIRLPFTYMNVDVDAMTDWRNGGGEYDFTEITRFVNQAAKYGIYTILDLHGAYGSQNGQDHSGESLMASQVDFYKNERKQKLTIDLWKALAKHFKGNPAVAAYDILNEPGEKSKETLDNSDVNSTTTRHWEFFDKVYDAIRSVDQDHMVIFESCWEAVNLPLPSEYGWKNCMYSFHHYSNCTRPEQTEAHKASVDAKIVNAAKRNFGVPIQMGEFTCYDNLEQWEYTLNALNEAGWHWCTWTYKINNTWGASAWGIIRIETTEADKVNAHEDSYETIVAKFEKLKTDKNVKYYEFYDGMGLFEVIYKYASAKY